MCNRYQHGAVRSFAASPQCARPLLQGTGGHPNISQTPQMPSLSNRLTTADAPANFPSRAPARAGELRVLKTNDSIRSCDDDPDLATAVNLGQICNTVVAQYEFKSLEFARPTRMVRVIPCHVGSLRRVFAAFAFCRRSCA